ncbi:hypothetical protein [Haloarcula halophila]|uniref:hypothetical protein n=1 Tax=Haloarcula TaxID=2237 RepID=UPI0023E3A16A|nr:hypothetical protein [Halomicroarcula sp. DFY41]
MAGFPRLQAREEVKRWLFVGAVVIAAALLGGIAGSASVHSAGTADCVDPGATTPEPSHGTHESAMYAAENGTAGECPIDDGARMGHVTT